MYYAKIKRIVLISLKYTKIKQHMQAYSSANCTMIPKAELKDPQEKWRAHYKIGRHASNRAKQLHTSRAQMRADASDFAPRFGCSVRVGTSEKATWQSEVGLEKFN